MKGPLPRVSATGALAVIATAACATATRQSSSPAVPASPAGQAWADGRAPYTAVDVRFMSGMIYHHAQAVLMAGWAPTHDASPSLRALCERIVVAQRDEIALMQRWLRDRHETVPPADPGGHTMPGMDHPMLMPGMLTPEQMARLDSARGLAFDRLFLRFMIQHHQGAITMVDELFGQGAGEEETVFRFASDVYADQTTEIDRMQRMLAALLFEGRGQ
ncbi:MAG TPA: DUF305 domain-containing protein [Gemmatimonadales bacterium]|nr:DUF305 domain-containing protein [Gemmatimonadales bacterium]